MLNLMEYPIAFTRPDRITPETPGWIDNIPFCFVLMQLHQPGILCELGTYTGISYCAFCQAVAMLRLPTRCYGVDHWKGDEHQGLYGEEVFEDLSEYHNARYSEFSKLMRMTFDDATSYFGDGSIDLLHIDGLHYYETVKHDFETWLPKMSDRGVVLLHDTNGKEKGFGVDRFLAELKHKHAVFEFVHGYGLGVIAVGARVSESPIWELFQADEREAHLTRSFFAGLGCSLVNEWRYGNQARHFKGLSEQLQQILEREGLVALRDAQLAERDAQIAFRDAKLAERDAQIAFRDAQLAERDAQIAARDAQLAERDTQIAFRDAQLAERDAQIAERDAQSAEKDAQIAESQVKTTWLSKFFSSNR